MKYLLSLVLVLLAFSLQPLQATAATMEAMLDTPSVDIFDSSRIMGMGQIGRFLRSQSPIQTLSNLVGIPPGQGRPLGAQLTAVTDTTPSGTTAAAFDETTLAVTEIIEVDIDDEAAAALGGRMYRPRLQIDYQLYPVPTYAAMPSDVQQKRMDKLNTQVQKRFGETVRVDYQENVHYLRGTTVSEQQRNVLELFVKMEPSVRQVRNEIVVRE